MMNQKVEIYIILVVVKTIDTTTVMIVMLTKENYRSHHIDANL